eukprot:131904-Chlamydomonas_euryale.AAC.4
MLQGAAREHSKHSVWRVAREGGSEAREGVERRKDGKTERQGVRETGGTVETGNRGMLPHPAFLTVVDTSTPQMDPFHAVLHLALKDRRLAR